MPVSWQSKVRCMGMSKGGVPQWEGALEEKKALKEQEIESAEMHGEGHGCCENPFGNCDCDINGTQTTWFGDLSAKF